MSRAMAKLTDQYLADYRNGVQTSVSGEASWLTALRRQAVTQLEQVGLPGGAWEDWRYTPVRFLERRFFPPAGDVNDFDVKALAATALDVDGPRLVFVNGRLRLDLSQNLQQLPKAGFFGSLHDAPEIVAERLGSHLGRYVDLSAHGFAALNTALTPDVCCLYLPAGVRIEQPLTVVFANSSTEQAASYPRLLIVLDSGSQATVVEQHLSLNGQTGLAAAVTEISLASNAALEFIRINQGIAGHQVGSVHVHQARDSRLRAHQICQNNQWLRNDLHVHLASAGAEVEMYGLYLAGARQHVDNHTLVDHQAPHTRSVEQYNGVLTGAGRAVFNGKVVVRPAAQKTDAQQSNRNLILISGGEVDTKPELQIFADDVRCTHGATVGQLDEDALFYLRSRGLDRAEAQALLTQAFAAGVLEKIQHEAVQTALSAHLALSLPA